MFEYKNIYYKANKFIKYDIDETCIVNIHNTFMKFIKKLSRKLNRSFSFLTGMLLLGEFPGFPKKTSTITYF